MIHADNPTPVHFTENIHLAVPFHFGFQRNEKLVARFHENAVNGNVILERTDIVNVINLVATTELDKRRISLFIKATDFGNHIGNGHRIFVKTHIAGLVHGARNQSLATVVACYANIHLRIVKDLVRKTLGNFLTKFLRSKTSHLELTRIRIEELTISRHLLTCRLILAHRRREFRMFPDNHLDHVQRSNPVFQVRERIHHQIRQIAFGRIGSDLHRFAHITLLNGMQLESHSIKSRGILRNFHTHLRSRKTTAQDRGSHSTKSKTYFVHTLPF